MKNIFLLLLFSNLALGSGFFGGGGGSSSSTTITASRAAVSDATGALTAATTTATEIGYVNGVTSAIQTQLNAKAGTGASFIPSTDNAYDLGSSSFRWKEAFFSGGFTSNSTGTTSNVAGTSYVRLFTNGTIDFKHASNAERHLLYAESDGLFYYGNQSANQMKWAPGSGNRITLLGSGNAHLVCDSSATCNLGSATDSFNHVYHAGSQVTIPKTVDVTADNQSVTVNDVSMIYTTSDNATADNRTIVLADGVSDGQRLLLVHNESAASGAIELADSGNANLSAAWTPDLGDNLSLVWNSGQSEWQETARTNN